MRVAIRMKKEEPRHTPDISAPSNERPKKEALQDGMPTVTASKGRVHEPRSPLTRAAVLLPACYLMAIVALIVIGLSPIAFGLCLGVAIVLATCVPFLMPLLVWCIELARAWNATEPMLICFGMCNCVLLYLFGTYLDQ